MVKTISSNLYISTVRTSMTGSGIRSGYVGLRHGIGAFIRTGGMHGIAVRGITTGIIATTGITVTRTARSAMPRIRVRTIAICVAP